MDFKTEDLWSTQGPNADICDFLLELAEFERNVNGDVNRYNAYRIAAAALGEYPTRVQSGSEARAIKGIGVKISGLIDEYLETGQLEKLEDFRASETNVAINLLAQVSGIGPVKARQLVDQGILTLDDLWENQEQLTHHQLIGLKYFDEFQMKISREEIEKLDDIVRATVEDLDPKYIITVCGSYRRGAKTSRDVDFLLTHLAFTSDGGKRPDLLENVVDVLTKKELITDSLSLGDVKFMGVCQLSAGYPHRRIDIHIMPQDQYYCGLLYFTGSGVFNRNMRLHAHRRGFILNQYCLRPVDVMGVPGEPLPITCERDIFDYIGYEYKEPKDRNAY